MSDDKPIRPMDSTTVEISCAEVWEEISNYIDEDVGRELKTRIELHLRNCNHCRAVLDGTRNSVRLLTDGEWYPLPTGFSERLYQRLSGESPKDKV
ncbi:MAG: zf-HC2 domain-containing protein [Candidatus Acidiferrales bacterium]